MFKERCRGTLTTLPFKRHPRRVIIETVHFTALWRNVVPSKVGISQLYSPREILTGTYLDYNKHCVLDFGEYVEVHDEPSPLNGMTSRTRPCIALGPTGNLQGTHKFMDINTGRLLKKRSWTRIPMPDTVIKKVEQRAEKEKRDGILRFRNRKNEKFDWDEGLDEALDCPTANEI